MMLANFILSPHKHQNGYLKECSGTGWNCMEQEYKSVLRIVIL
jgi:hypothetical protein